MLDLAFLTLLSTLMLFLPVAPGGVLHWFLITVMQLKLMSREHLLYVFFLFGLVLFNFVISFLLEVSVFVMDLGLILWSFLADRFAEHYTDFAQQMSCQPNIDTRILGQNASLHLLLSTLE